MNEYRKPAWWILYLLYALMVALLLAQAGLAVSQGWHQVMELGVTGTMLGLMAWWARRNARALEDEVILRNIKQRTAQHRKAPLTAIQARYLVAQERHRREQCYEYGKE